jgi:hypothetical protein
MVAEAITTGNWGRKRLPPAAAPVIPDQTPKGTDMAGQTVNTNQGKYVMQGPTSGGVPVIRTGQTIPELRQPRLPATVATQDNPLIKKGQAVTTGVADPRQKEIEIMVKKAKNESLNDDDLRYLAEKELSARDRVTTPAVPAGWDPETYSNFKNANPTLEPTPEDTFRMKNAGGPEITAEDIAAMTPEQRMMYEKQGFEQNRNNQLDAIDEFGNAQQDVYNKRIADANAQIDQTKSDTEAQNSELLKAFADEQNSAAAASEQDVREAGAEGMSTLQRSAARRGMSRSSETEGAIAKATKNTQQLVGQIELATNQAIRTYQVQLLDKMDQKMQKLQDRVTSLGDAAADAELNVMKEKQKTYVDLMSQDPSNPQNMIALADKLKTQQLAELKENNAAAAELRKEAQANFQFMVGSFGSQAFANTSPEEMANLAANLGVPASALQKLPATLKEQENQWEKLKYTADRQWDASKYAQDRQDKFALADMSNSNDWQKLLWQAAREDEKSNSQLNSILSSVGIEYADKASGASPNAMIYDTPVPHPVSGGSVVEVNTNLALAKPEGFKYSSSNGPLAGQCKWYSEQLTNLGGKGWTIGSTAQETKAGLDKYVKQGLAYYPGQEDMQVGQTIITNDSKTYWHSAVINAIQEDGGRVLTESNYAGPLKVTNTRVVYPGDPSIQGVLKTTPKPQYQIAKAAVAAVGSVTDKLGPLGKVISAIGKSNPNIGESISQTLAGLLPSGETVQPAEASQPVETPTKLNETQIRGIDSLSSDEKALLRQKAPQVWNMYLQSGGAKDQASAADIRMTRKEVYAMPVVKNFESLNDTYKKMDSSYNAYTKGKINKGGVDQALVMMFNKMLDPTSAVREGEYARTMEGQSALDRAQQFVVQVSQGGAGITDKTRTDMVALAKELQGAAQKQFNDQMKFYVDLAPELGTTPQNILGAYYQYYQPDMGQASNDLSNNSDSLGINGGGGDSLGIL